MPKTKLKIFIAEPDNFSQNVIVELEKIGKINYGPVQNRELPGIFETYDIFWFRLGHKINLDTMGPGSFRCKIIATAVTGIDHIDHTYLKKNGITLISLKGETEFLKKIRATAEHTISLMMAISRKLIPAIESVKKGAWDRDQFRGHELYKKTIGIIGMGRLGTIVAEYARAFGMQVIAWDKPDVLFPDYVNRKSKIKEMVSESDFISIHLDLNDHTKNLINQEILSCSSPQAYWINTSRGGIVDEKALLNGLENNTIAGAALDVLACEPDIENNLLVLYAEKNENLIITPHIGGNTFESFEKTEEFILAKILQFCNTSTNL